VAVVEAERDVLIVPVGPFLTLLREVDLGDARLVVLLGVVVLVAVDEHDEVGVLLDRPGLAQVGQDRPLVVALLDLPGELRERDDGHVEVAGEDLQRRG
jgi:hypothetical protein